MYAFVGAIYIFFFILGSTLYTLLCLNLQNTKQSSMIPSTYRLQVMLLHAISSQLFIGYIFLLFPAVALCLMVYLDVPNTGKYASFFLTLMSIHSFFDCLSIMYFIVPYRKAIMNWLGIKQRYADIIS
jgi:hypothetical protein